MRICSTDGSMLSSTPGELVRPPAAARVPSGIRLRERTADEFGLLVDGLFAHDHIDKAQIGSMILGSVVPPLTSTMRAMGERYFRLKALTIEPGLETGMPILCDNPGEVGADRVVN